jgi:hypothetical protein
MIELSLKEGKKEYFKQQHKKAIGLKCPLCDGIIFFNGELFECSQCNNKIGDVKKWKI